MRVKLRPLDPRVTYSHSLTKIRKEFAAEVQLQQAEAREKLLAKQQAKDAQKDAMWQDVVAYKKEQRLFEQTHFQPSNPSESQPPIAKEDDTKKIERRQRHTELLKSHSQFKMDSVLALFHSASQFVTYANVDEKIDVMLRNQPVVHMPLDMMTSQFHEEKKNVLKHVVLGEAGSGPNVRTIEDFAVKAGPMRLGLDEDVQKYEAIMFADRKGNSKMTTTRK